MLLTFAVLALAFLHAPSAFADDPLGGRIGSSSDATASATSTVASGAQAASQQAGSVASTASVPVAQSAGDSTRAGTAVTEVVSTAPSVGATATTTTTKAAASATQAVSAATEAVEPVIQTAGTVLSATQTLAEPVTSVVAGVTQPVAPLVHVATQAVVESTTAVSDGVQAQSAAGALVRAVAVRTGPVVSPFPGEAAAPALVTPPSPAPSDRPIRASSAPSGATHRLSAGSRARGAGHTLQVAANTPAAAPRALVVPIFHWSFSATPSVRGGGSDASRARAELPEQPASPDVPGLGSNAASSAAPPPAQLLVAIVLSLALIVGQRLGRRLRLRPESALPPQLVSSLERPG